MKNTLINKAVIQKIAGALGELNERVVYVGGAVVSLYVNDLAAGDVRPTKDIDISVDIATVAELENIRLELVKKGFTQTADDDVMCRFRYHDIAVDVMGTTAVGWAPANPWFAPGFHYAERIIVEEASIRILSLPYFLAAKFSAYHDRGNNDPRTSHDIEDIIYILDNRMDLVEQIEQSHGEVKIFLKEQFKQMLKNDLFQEAIRANLFYETQTERFQMVREKLQHITNTAL